MRGHARLTVERVGERSVLSAVYCASPLHVQGSLATPERHAELAVLNVAGGVVGGDSLTTDVTVAPAAPARLITVGATRLYRCDDRPSASTLNARVGWGALLEYLPDETIPYAGADHVGSIEVDLESSGAAILGEVIAPGRLHHGERFAYRRLLLRTAIREDGAPLLRDVLLLQPDRLAPTAPTVLGAYTHLATLYACGRGADPTLADALYRLLADARIHGGATTGAHNLVIMRALGHDAHTLLGIIRRAAALCRVHLRPAKASG